MYNVVRLQNELGRIFENEGGEVVRADKHSELYSPKKDPIYVVNRSINERIKELERLTAHPENVSENYMSEFRCLVDELERLHQINNDPILKTDAHAFVLDDMFYSIMLDSNMFFDNYFLIAPVFKIGNIMKARLDVYTKLPDTWAHDCMCKRDCSAEDIREIANELFNFLMKQARYVKRQIGDEYYIHSIKKGSELQ